MGAIFKNEERYAGGSSGSASFPSGGTTGQALVKHSNADNDVEWGDVSVDVDTNPEQGSTNPVSSGGVYAALANKVDAVSGKGLSTNDYDNTEKGKVAKIGDTTSLVTTDKTDLVAALNETYNRGVVMSKVNLADVYSTTERIVGCWTDGRPLYQKTVTGTTPSASGLVTVAPTTAKEIIKAEGKLTDVNRWIVYSTNYVEGDTPQTFGIGADKDTGYKIWMQLNTATKSRPYVLTIWYTKTTDAAGSYYLAGENDYSTDEKIIGKWIDGKNIYRKVYTGTTGTVSGSVETAIALDTYYRINGKKILNIRGGLDYYVSGSDYGRVALPWYAAANNRAEVQDSGHGSLVIYMCGSFFSNCEYEVVVEYIKTS